ncbi:MAG: aspartate carbamoyltransferase regulatory subunit [Clostridiales bacterium]|jgi:aspartate carbamoyltransferase regulatory subunit|nr:aspartate carbamoyltransferase regulatory subunit [Bacillota bacterium]MBS6860616.1 aspartate carbamoyltransferase regulatory subunit [Clostridiales bacterium]PWM41750.1 MAG: aspartate carbamoyltransferase regulatory subunit [Clostridiales bacterium]
MLNIDSLQNGIVIDHIKAGASMAIYDLLKLGKLDCCVAIIKNARSAKYGKKDIIKIDGELEIDLDMLGFLDPNITVGIIRDGKLVEKRKLVLPKELRNVIKCKNPRCITSVEEGIDHIFLLGENQRYRCAYCEQEYDPRTGKRS